MIKQVKTAIKAHYNGQPIGAATNGCYHIEVPRRKKRPYTTFAIRSYPQETMAAGVDYEWVRIEFTIWTNGKSAGESDDLFDLLITAFDNEPNLNVLGFKQIRLDRGESEQYQDPDAGRDGGWRYDIPYLLKLQRLT